MDPDTHYYSYAVCPSEYQPRNPVAPSPAALHNAAARRANAKRAYDEFWALQDRICRAATHLAHRDMMLAQIRGFMWRDEYMSMCDEPGAPLDLEVRPGTKKAWFQTVPRDADIERIRQYEYTLGE